MAKKNHDPTTFAFLEKIIDAFHDFLKDRSHQTPRSLREQLTEFQGYFMADNPQEKKEVGVCRELRRQFGGGAAGYLDFLNELLKKSYGVQLKYDADSKTFNAVNEVPMPPAMLPAHVNVFDLLQLAKLYHPPGISFQPYQEKSDGLETVIRAAFVKDQLQTIFDSRFERTRVCTKNKERHSLAAFQDAADPFVHRLQITKTTQRSRGEETSSMLELKLVECFSTEELEPVILVEAIQGDASEEDRHSIFRYTVDCLSHYLLAARTTLYFNMSFNTNSQPEPMEFVNFVASQFTGIFIYSVRHGKYSITDQGKDALKESKYWLAAVQYPLTNRPGDSKQSPVEWLLNQKKRVRQRFSRRYKGYRFYAEKHFHNPDTILTDFQSERRYADSWQPYEFKVIKNPNKPQWNNRKGYVSAIKLTKRMLDASKYRQPMDLNDKLVIAVFTPIAAIALALTTLTHFVDIPSLTSYCSRATVQDLVAYCVDNDNDIQKIPVENISSTKFKQSADGVVFNIAIGDGERHALRFGNRWDDAVAFLYALSISDQMRRYVDQSIQSSDRKLVFDDLSNMPAHLHPESAHNKMGVLDSYLRYIASSAQDIHLLMRLQALYHVYGFSESFEFFTRKIAEELDYSRSSEGVERAMTATQTLLGEDEKNVFAGRFFTRRVTLAISSFLYETTRRGNLDIALEALLLVDEFVKDTHVSVDSSPVFLPPDSAYELLMLFDDKTRHLSNDVLLGYLTCLNINRQQPIADRLNTCYLPIL